MEPVFYHERPTEVKEAYCSADLARRLLGYRRSIGLDAGLQRTIDFIRQEGPREFVYHYDIEIVRQGITPVTWIHKMV